MKLVDDRVSNNGFTVLYEPPRSSEPVAEYEKYPTNLCGPSLMAIASYLCMAYRAIHSIHGLRLQYSIDRRTRHLYGLCLRVTNSDFGQRHLSKRAIPIYVLDLLNEPIYTGLTIFYPKTVNLAVY